ncbi:response regulator [Paenibacillus eucommiae]|uniref:Two-component system response regulator YesN n=1 Tax=Paenibacillus eucommiae TaxID=1355755 RepID=A0ABS4IYG6_9BACL|nr:response regulator [Paenibacillus eucommiae]MBP1992110.1 two-component system response regulator YesN [Paenibacillus eucommiae]
MKIMIIDDEVIIRTGLCTVIDWKELGLTLLEPAESAEEALERIPAEKPHIVLTDIRMPGMDGIQLAKEIKSYLPDTEIVILTGYDDFAYAQQALREGVTDYLLKTSGPEEIIKAAMKAKKNILDKWESMKQKTEQAAAMRNQLFERMLTGSGEGAAPVDISMAPVRDWLEQNQVIREGPGGSCQPMRVTLVGASGWGEGTSSSLLLGAVENILSDLLPCVTLLKKDKVIVVSQTDEGLTGTRQLEKAIHRMRDTLKCAVFAAAGDTTTSVEDLQRSYKEAENLYSFRILFGDQGLFTTSDIERCVGGRTVCSQKEESELSAILMSNDAVQLRRWSNEIVREQMEDTKVTPATLRAFLQSIVIVAHRWLDRAMENRNVEKRGVQLLSFEPDTKPHEELFKLLLSVMNAFHELVSDSRYSYIHRAIVYIREHLDQHLTLQQVAKFVHLNPNYLSEVFKKEMGLSYIEFITQERMNRAANILRSTDKKVSEIALEVGYEDMKYFSQQFKKYMGRTPSEFRQFSNY